MPTASPKCCSGPKKTGLGTGKTVGLAGTLRKERRPRNRQRPEVKEESRISVDPAALIEVAGHYLPVPGPPHVGHDRERLHVRRLGRGPPQTAEIIPHWFPVSALPLERMRDDGRYWLPRVLAGERLRAVFTYADDCETVATADIQPLTGP